MTTALHAGCSLLWAPQQEAGCSFWGFSSSRGEYNTIQLLKLEKTSKIKSNNQPSSTTTVPLNHGLKCHIYLWFWKHGDSITSLGSLFPNYTTLPWRIFLNIQSKISLVLMDMSSSPVPLLKNITIVWSSLKSLILAIISHAAFKRECAEISRVYPASLSAVGRIQRKQDEHYRNVFYHPGSHQETSGRGATAVRCMSLIAEINSWMPQPHLKGQNHYFL